MLSLLLLLPAQLLVALSAPPAAPATLPAGVLHFPPGVFADAAQFGAVSDGVTDTTRALQRAISATVGFHPGVRGHSINVTNLVLLLQPGVFLVSDTLAGRDTSGEPQCYMTLQGSGTSATTLLLHDMAAGFADAADPKPVVYTASCKDAASYAPGDGESGFKNGVFDLSIDVGRGNPGAVALDFLGNNKASIARVKLIGRAGSGVVGLSLVRRYVGPMLVKRLAVEGFAVGVNVSNPQCSVTMVDINLTAQTFAGIVNSRNIVSVEKLWSEQASSNVPAVLLTPAARGAKCPDGSNSVAQSLMTIIGAHMTANHTLGPSTTSTSASSSAAVQIECGCMYGRALTSTGYGAVVSPMAANAVAGIVGETAPAARTVLTVDEYVHPAQNVTSLFAPIGKSLRLAIQDTPDNDTALFAGNIASWVSVCDPLFGTTPACGNGYSGDDTLWVERALNSGSRVVFFPARSFRIMRTIVIDSPNLAEIVGMEATVQSVGEFFVPGNHTVQAPAIFRVERSAPVLTIRQLTHETRGWGCHAPLWCKAVFLEHASASTIVLRHLLHGGVVSSPPRGGAAMGDLFAEDVCCGAFHLSLPQRAWLRQLNIENRGVHLSVSGGAQVWVLGMKTEQAGGQQIKVDGPGSAVEVLGGFFMPFDGMVDNADPAAISVSGGARASFGFAESSFAPVGVGAYPVLVEEELGGEVRRFNASNAPKRGGGYGTLVPLFSTGPQQAASLNLRPKLM